MCSMMAHHSALPHETTAESSLQQNGPAPLARTVPQTHLRADRLNILWEKVFRFNLLLIKCCCLLFISIFFKFVSAVDYICTNQHNYNQQRCCDCAKPIRSGSRWMRVWGCSMATEACIHIIRFDEIAPSLSRSGRHLVITTKRSRRAAHTTWQASR